MDDLSAFMAREGLPEAFLTTAEHVCEPLAQRIARLRQVRRRTIIVGLCGAQGSGKSTIAAVTRLMLAGRGLKTVVLSLDDFYLTRDARERLAKEVHPLLAVRGPPGTHDVGLAGVVLGGFTNCNLDEGKYSALTLDEVFDDYFKPLNVPVYSGAQFGHIKRKFTLPIGRGGICRG